MSGAMVVLELERRKFESSCSAAVAQIRHARDMRGVSFAAAVSVPPLLRAFVRQELCFRKVHSSAETRMSELLADHLAKAREIKSLDARKEFIGRLRTHDWLFLRGDYPRVAHQAEQGARTLLAR